MRVLIPGVPYNPNLSSPPANKFCDAKAYLIYNTDDNSILHYDNTIYSENRINLIEILNLLKIDNVIAYNICEACFETIRSANISVWFDGSSRTIREAFQKFELGGLFLHANPIRDQGHRKIINSKRNNRKVLN